MAEKYRVLILGASYGSLFAWKLLMAGHDATLICRSQIADLIQQWGTRVRVQAKGREGWVEINSRVAPSKLDALAPDQVVLQRVGRTLDSCSTFH